MTTRTATAHDARAIATLSRQLGYASSERSLIARLEPILCADGHAVFVVDDPQGHVLGWIHVCEVRRVESDPFAEIGGLVVHEAYRRRGMGQRLVRQVEAWASARGVGKLRVRTRTDRVDALAFYTGLGFSTVKQQAVLDKKLE